MNKKNSVKISVVQYQPELLSDWKAYTNKISNIVDQAKEQGAELILFPEYAGLELLSLQQGKPQAQLMEFQKTLSRYVEFYEALANQYQLYIQPGTLLTSTNDTHYVNRAYFFSPNDKFGYQNKIHLTRSESSEEYIQKETTLNIFETALGKIGIVICYDVEFPSLVHQLVDAGANIILVPSLTESMAGFHRVHLSSRARALENQCFVAQASLIGTMPWCDFTDECVGQSGIFGPVDVGFPDDGILALAKLNQPEILFAELNLEELQTVRRVGHVSNFIDMQILAKRRELPINHFNL